MVNDFGKKGKFLTHSVKLDHKKRISTKRKFFNLFHYKRCKISYKFYELRFLIQWRLFLRILFESSKSIVRIKKINK